MPDKTTKTTQKTKQSVQVAVRISFLVGVVAVLFIGLSLVIVFFQGEREPTKIDTTVTNPCTSVKTDNFYGSTAEESKLSALTSLQEIDCRENIVKLQGQLNILAVDDFENNVSYEVYTLLTEQKEYEVFFVPTPGLPLSPDMQLEVLGYQIGEHALLLDSARDLSASVEMNEGTGYQVLSSEAPAFAAGPQKTLVLLVNFSNTSAYIPSTTLAQEVMTLVDLYYGEVSYNQINLTAVQDTGQPADVRGWYSLNSSTPDCQSFSLLNFSQEVFNTIYQQVDLSLYQDGRVIIVAPFGCSWAGWAYYGLKDIILPDSSTITASIAGINAKYFDFVNFNNHPPTLADLNNGSYNNADKIVTYVGHELGHNFNNGHAAFLPCDIQTKPVSQCTIDHYQEYHDGYDIMGNWGAHHFNLKHQETSGWFSPANMQTVSSDGTFDLYPIENISTSELKGLKIPRTAGQYLYVEYREENINNFDFEMPHWSTPPASNVYEGALLHVDHPVKNWSLLIYPEGKETSHPSAPALLPGQTFTDPATGTAVKVIEKLTNPNRLRVEVTFNTSLQCSDGTLYGHCTGYGIAGLCYGGQLIAADCLDCGCETNSFCAANGQCYTCGNVDQKTGPGGPVDVADLTYLVAYLFQGGLAPDPYLAADLDSSSFVNVADLTYLVNYLFQGGPDPCSPPETYIPMGADWAEEEYNRWYSSVQ